MSHAVIPAMDPPEHIWRFLPASGRSRVIVGAGATFAIVMVITVVILATRHEGDRSAPASVAQRDTSQCTAARGAGLPHLPARLRYLPVDVTSEVRTGARRQGVFVGRLMENGRQVSTILSVPIRPHEPVNDRLLREAERSLRQRDLKPRRVVLASYGALVTRLPGGEQYQVVTHGSCRSYSLVGASDRSARAIARMLLRAETPDGAR